ncbi:Ig-like domain-containing protein [Pantoea dispersa]|uniref:Ig-like domain-containing protein n=1 Tax=Pantoea dispersa TaxID=59814 RepID=UPI0021F71EB2|nr:Ig-like domain-containing protein [Pantoea dispersa]MCW0322814.1 hypothetical protein [Pantoea dispersa]MCW0327232.1 hypothetical protein [Pantoea dispersa]MCW0433657.1 hypothetical protein [Pantoea dispersa]
MSVGYYDPTKPGQENYVNSPYQYWKGVVEDKSVSYIEFAINGQLFTTQVNADGSWEYQLPLRLEEGSHNLTIRFFDRAGNAGIPFQTRLEVDLSPPDMPAIMRVLDDFGPVQGPVGNKGFTDDKTPAISGYAEPDSIVRLYSNGVLIGSVQAAKNGQWTITPELSDGEQRLYVTATDKFGQVSFDSPVFTLYVNSPRIDKPQLLEVYDNEGPNNGVIKAGSESDDRNPRLSGNAPLDAESVVIYINGERVGIAPVVDGQWHWESNIDLLNFGNNTITVRAQNNRGELSNESEPFTYKVIPTPEAKIDYAFDNEGLYQGRLDSGALTNDFSPILKGSAEANSVVYVHAQRINGYRELLGSVRADAQGNWEIETNKLTQGDGDYEFQVGYFTQPDTQAEKFSLTIISGETVMPVIESAFDDVGSSTGALKNGAVTDDYTPTLSGRAEANSIVYFFDKHVNGTWARLGSVKADAQGNWTFTTPNLGGYLGEHTFQVSNSEKRYTNGSTYQLTLQPEKPNISNAIDNEGGIQGELKNGDYTDDFTPTLTGWAASNSLVYVYAQHDNGNWQLLGSTRASNFGAWNFTTSNLSGQHGEYQFQVSSSSTRDPSANIFKLEINDNAVRVGDEGLAWDFDDGTLQGWMPAGLYKKYNQLKTTEWKGADGSNVLGSMTDFVEGRDYSGDVVYRYIEVEAGKTYELDFDGYRLNQGWVAPVIGMEVDGKTVIKPEALTSSWQHKSGIYVATETKVVKVAVTNATANGYGNDFLLDNLGMKPVEVTPVDRQGLDWDFNDGTLQGWMAAGLYEKYNQLKTTEWKGADGSNVLGSMTDFVEGRDYSGDVVYRYIEVEAGKTYELDFDGYRLNQGWVAPVIGMEVDGKTVIKPEALTSSWQHKSGIYVATETKVVKVAVTNATANGYGNDFLLDNLGIKPVNVTNVGKQRIDWDFNDGTLQGWMAAGIYEKLNQIKTTYWKGEDGSNVLGSTTDANNSGRDYSGEVVYQYIQVEAGKSYTLGFDGQRINKSYAPPVIGIQVDGADIVAPATLTQTWQHFSGVYTATETKVVKVAVVNNTSNAYGNDFLLDNLFVQPQNNSVTKVIAAESILTEMLASGEEAAVIDMLGNGKNTLSVSVADVLSAGSKDLFIVDGKTQLLIKGDAQDVVKLDDILGDGGDVGDWVKQQGSTTVAGVKYQVYSHSGIDADVLIQEGVKTELV